MACGGFAAVANDSFCWGIPFGSNTIVSELLIEHNNGMNGMNEVEEGQKWTGAYLNTTSPPERGASAQWGISLPGWPPLSVMAALRRLLWLVWHLPLAVENAA